MPSESIYLPADCEATVRDVRDAQDLDNKSQAIQHIIRAYRGDGDE